MLDTDAETFDRVIQDLCLAFNRPHSTELTRVYWESLKHVHIADVKRAALSARNNLKKFPTPKDLIPERRYAETKPKEPEPQMSSWAVAANKILFQLAYLDERRGFKPIAEWEPMPANGLGLPLRMPELIDDSLLRRCIEFKADYVRMAEEADAAGEPMTPREFNAMCIEGFERLLLQIAKEQAA